MNIHKIIIYGYFMSYFMYKRSYQPPKSILLIDRTRASRSVQLLTNSKRIGSTLLSERVIAKLLCITCKFVAALAAINLAHTWAASYSSDFVKFQRRQIVFLDRGTSTNEKYRTFNIAIKSEYKKSQFMNNKEQGIQMQLHDMPTFLR